YDDHICVHVARDHSLRRPRESAPESDPHIKRYRNAGAMSSAQYRIPERGSDIVDEFFASEIMSHYSEAVIAEGDSPFGFQHLSAYVARVLPKGESLLVAGKSDERARRKRELAEAERIAKHPELLLDMLSLGHDDLVTALLKQNPDILRRAGEKMREGIDELRSQPLPKAAKTWRIAESLRGIEDAGLVVINIFDASERERAEEMVRDMLRLRSDREIFDAVLGPSYERTPVTVVAANLVDPKDPGRKKAIARIKRAIAKGREG
ncbi:MAG: hypothetical protein KFF77_04815, partial [Bacteroidetes bacterium]|nr:hypothetical protein [Bacteroidota bacterium]